jgi:hypothetical protein
MGMTRAITTGGCILLLLSTLHAQSIPPRLRGKSAESAATPQTQPAATSPPAPSGAGQPGTGQPGAAQPAAPSVPVAPEVAPSLLQQPAQEAKITFDKNNLSIHADNSSLASILRQVASSSGMKVEGLSGDERVFGTFGPGAPRDVIAELLDGTPYNVALIGDLDNGAPRELVLTPTTHGAAAPAPAPQASSDDASDQEAPEVPVQPPPEVPQQPATQTPGTPGVRTPQQLFEQLQRMRQGQGGAQQPAPVQQDSPQQ